MKQDRSMGQLIDLVARLRDPVGGCPWDIEQTFASTVSHTIEEAYEVADAIEKSDMTLLKEELGDLLLQVVFYAQMAQEHGLFAFIDITSGIIDKLIRRHPHVFGDLQVDSADAQLVMWELLKKDERLSKDINQQPSALDGIATALPALLRASKLSIRAACWGFDWPSAARAIDEIGEEIAELRASLVEETVLERLEEEVGDLLLSCANLARQLKVDPETALRKANSRFEYRFRRLESLVGQAAPASANTLELLWQRLKTENKP